MPNTNSDKQLIAKRLIELMKALGFENQREWALSMGYDRPDNVYNATNGDRLVGTPLLIDISNTFVNANIGWILSGKGKMLLDSVVEQNKSGSTHEPDPNLLTLMTQEIDTMQLSLQKISRVAAMISGLDKPEDHPAMKDLALDKKDRVVKGKKGSLSEKDI